MSCSRARRGRKGIQTNTLCCITSPWAVLYSWRVWESSRRACFKLFAMSCSWACRVEKGRNENEFLNLLVMFYNGSVCCVLQLEVQGRMRGLLVCSSAFYTLRISIVLGGLSTCWNLIWPKVVKFTSGLNKPTVLGFSIFPRSTGQIFIIKY